MSATYRLFKLPKLPSMLSSTVTYKGTVAEFPDQLDFDSSHCFKVFDFLLFRFLGGNFRSKEYIFHLVAVYFLMQKDTTVELNGEMAAILQHSRFATDFNIRMLNEQNFSSEPTPQEVSIKMLFILVTNCFSSE